MSTPQYNVVGKSTPQLQAVDIVTGEQMYSNDYSLPGMLYAKFVRSSQPFATLTGIDTTAAKALPGVRGILTYEDVMAPPLSTYFPLVDGVVRLVGDDIAVVAADTSEIAEQAVELIDPTVQYDPMQPYFDVEDALAPGAAVIWPEYQTSTLQGNWDFYPAVHRSKGNVAQGFANASATVQQTFYVPAQFHECLEPRTILINWAPDNIVTEWCSTQTLGDSSSLAASVGLPMSQCRIICPRIGGGFGSKGPGTSGPTAWQTWLAWLSKQTGRPVKFVSTYEEESIAAVRMNARYVNTKAGAASNGAITALQCNTLLDNGANNGGITRAQNSCTAPFDLYTHVCPNVDATIYSGMTNTIPRGAFRGYGNTKQTLALATVMDRLAEQLGMDRMTFLNVNLVHTGDPVCKRDTDPLNPLSSGAFPQQVATLSTLSSWATKQHAPGALTLPNGNLHGIGVGPRIHWAAMMPNGSYSSASVKVMSDGSVFVYVGTGDIGGGQTTVAAMVCAETLGVPLASVQIGEYGDTQGSPYHNCTCSSQTTYMVGNAVIAAANDAKQQLLALAAPMLGVAVTDLNIKNGMIYVIDNPSKTMPISAPMLPWFIGGPCNILGRGQYTEVGMPFSTGVVVVEVEVDPGTGQIIIDNIWGSTDSGFSINPGMVELQEEGGEIMGIGYVLSEAYILDTNTGKVLSMNPIDDRIPVTPPYIYPPYQAQPIDPNGPFGAKGIGEPGLMGSPGAIVNAIYNATGVRFTELPITPDKILSALGKFSGSVYHEVETGTTNSLLGTNYQPPSELPKEVP